MSNSLAKHCATRLAEIVDEVEGLIDFAIENGFRAVEHKLDEAMGPLCSAHNAAQQYDSGELTPREHTY